MAHSNATNLDQAMIKPSVQTRRVSSSDLPSLPPIFNHTIATSVISFRLAPVNTTFYEDVLKSTHANDLPFIVATTLAPPVDGGAEAEEGIAAVEKVIGYAYAHPFRPGYQAYRHTVEITIYVHHEYHSVGAGTALMDALMAALRTTRVRDPTVAAGGPDVLKEGEDGEGDHERPDGTGRIRQVLSIMSLDTEGRDGGHGLEKFYSRWGFERVGCMKKVGFKFGRWIDVLVLQVSL